MEWKYTIQIYKYTQRKITILGAGAVGKSAITVRMVANEFQKEYDPTIEANYTYDTNLKYI